MDETPWKAALRAQLALLRAVEKARVPEPERVPVAKLAESSEPPLARGEQRVTFTKRCGARSR